MIQALITFINLNNRFIINLRKNYLHVGSIENSKVVYIFFISNVFAEIITFIVDWIIVRLLGHCQNDY